MIQPTPQQEAEANYFAMCLLMPEEFIRRDIADMGPVAFDDPRLRQMAERYKVEFGLLMIRLGQLGYMGGQRWASCAPVQR